MVGAKILLEISHISNLGHGTFLALHLRYSVETSAAGTKTLSIKKKIHYFSQAI